MMLHRFPGITSVPDTGEHPDSANTKQDGASPGQRERGQHHVRAASKQDADDGAHDSEPGQTHVVRRSGNDDGDTRQYEEDDRVPTSHDLPVTSIRVEIGGVREDHSERSEPVAYSNLPLCALMLSQDSTVVAPPLTV